MQRKLSKEQIKNTDHSERENLNTSRLLKNKEARGNAIALGILRENNWHLKIMYPGKLSF